MMTIKKGIIITLFFSVLFVVVSVLSNPKKTYATESCRSEPCCDPSVPGSGYYVGCGDGCKCEDELANEMGVCENIACPRCIPGDCPPGWDEGACGPGESNCYDKSFECTCGNAETVCKKYTGPSNTPPPTQPPTVTSPPTETPPPTSTPPPSPTPIQPTEIIEFPLPSPTVFSQKAKDPITRQDAQSWICLDTIPCATGGITCSGGDPQHRVRIANKEENKLVPNKETYIFECLETPQGYRCTTGNRALGQELIGADYLPDLSSTYGYQFIAYTDTQNQSILQSVPEQVIKSDSEGNIGPLEWESYTSIQVGRVMMSMQSLLDGEDIYGKQKTQKLGTFGDIEEEAETICVMIKWDPHGTIYNLADLKPISGVKVTLLRKDTTNVFAPVNSKDIFGGLENPMMTKEDGTYAFYVPNGTYKLILEKEGYEPFFNIASLDEKIRTAYPHTYDGGEIITNGRLELRNVAMRKITIIDTSLNFIKQLIQTVGNSLK